MRKGEVVLKVVCALDEDHFGPWEELTDEQRAVFDDHATRCNGAGIMGSWCGDCHFCVSIEEEVDS